MEKTKRIFSIFLVVLMFFTSLPMNAFAEEIATQEETTAVSEEIITEEVTATEEETNPEDITSEDDTTDAIAPEEPVYEIGETYIIDGVRYGVREDGTVVVWGEGAGMPEKVELLSYLGEYPVTSMATSAFDYATNLKELIIPETVKIINGLNKTGIEKIEIRGDYVSIGIAVLGSSPFFKNQDNWKDGLLTVGSCLIAVNKEGEVVLGEEITSVAQHAFRYYDNVIDTVKVYNENCVIPKVSSVFPMGTKLCGKEDSTLKEYYEAFTGYKYKFEKLCFCEDTVTVEETSTLCDGTLGYTRGEWCEQCQVWKTGHRKNETVSHFDENSDRMCDFCSYSLDNNIIDSGIVGDNAYWSFDEEGTLLICGLGDLYDFTMQKDVGWYDYKAQIKKIFVTEGIERLSTVSFEGCKSIESISLADTVVSLPSSFRNCIELKSVSLSASLRSIPSHCFSGCTALESITVPESVVSIGSFAFYGSTSLKEIIFENGYITLGSDVFYGTAAYNDPSNIRDGFLFINNCLIKEISAENSSLVLGSEITSIAPDWSEGGLNTVVTELTVYNPECVFPDSSAAVPSGAVLYGLLGSTAEKYSKTFGKKFVPFCICEDTQLIPENNGHCDGTVGYTEGVWCERCQLWVSGHEEKPGFIHIDEDEDLICDFCKTSVETGIMAAGKCGDNMSWRIMDDYTLFIDGTGEMYSFAKESAPWYSYAENLTDAFVSDGITSIGDYAFYNCKNIRSVELSSVLLKIGAYAFYGCESLMETDIPEAVYIISEKAFYGCRELRSIVIPEAVTTLGNGIFTGCSGLEVVEVKGSITAIPDSMFADCENLVTFESAKNIKNIGEKSFYNCKSLASFEGFYVRTMGKNAFALCESLVEIRIKSIDELPASAFRGCKNLSDVALSSSLEIIGTAAFLGCTSLKSIVLPKSVATVNAGAFGGCDNLEEITFMNDSVSISTADVVTGGGTYKALPQTVTIKANAASKADAYADVNELNFVPLTEKEISSVVLAKEPSQLIYVIGKDTAFSRSGAKVRVTYTDSTSITLTKRFTVDWKDADISKSGTYTCCAVYGSYELPFEITVVTGYSFCGIPENGDFGEIFCTKNEITAVCFIPSETGEYTFAFDGGTGLEITADSGVSKRGGINFTEKYTYEEGKEYYFYIKSTTADRTVSFRKTEDFYFVTRSDGTLEVKLCLASGDVVIPSEYGGIPVTKVSDSFRSNSLLNNVNYMGKITVSEGIKEIGESAFYNHKYDIVLPESITKIGKKAFEGLKGNVNIPSSLENIGDYAFYNSAVSNVVLPEGLKKIGSYAFSGCNNIEALELELSSVSFGSYIFADCTGIESVNIGENVTSLGKYMFRGCESLREVTGCDGLRKISDGVFSGCKSLEKADFISQLTEIGSYAFYNCTKLSEIKLSDSIDKIKDYSFYGCDEVKEIQIPQGVTEVGEYAFYNCSSLEKITFSGNLKEIRRNAFSYTAIRQIDLPDSVETMERSCFSYCRQLSEFTLPEKITTVSDFTFSGCSALERVDARGYITEIADYAFSYCDSLKELGFWDSVERVDMNAFEQCTALENAPFESVNYIEQNAFKNCTELESVSLPEENTVIEGKAFYRCLSLKSVDIKANSSVGTQAFYSCSSLETVIVGENTSLSKEAFAYCSSLKELYLFNEFSAEDIVGSFADGAVIYGYEGSSAQQYAQKKGIEFIAVEGHVHSYTVTRVEPDKCFEYTKLIYTCACGYSYTENEHLPTGTHYYGDFVTDKEPTCTEYGLKSRHCHCGKNRKDITLIDPLGHTEVIDIPAVAPTATEPGYTHQSHCSVCGETVVKRELISHSEYDILVDDSEVTAYKFDVATAENDGMNLVITFTTRNDVCMSNIDKTVIYKVGEVKLSKTELTYNGKVQKPVVTVKDSTGELLILNRDYKVTYSADSKYCGKYSVRVDYVGNYAGNKALYYEIVHNWGAGKVTESPSCTKTGMKTYTCGCGGTYSETVAKLVHSYSNACDTTCNRCSAKRTITHSYKSVTTKATLTKNGKIENKCLVCGYVSKTTTVYYPKTIKLSKTAYTYNGKVQTPSVTVKDSKGNTLKKNTDYTVKYESGRKAAGTYTVAITFNGKYSGTKKLTYTIAPKATSKVTASQTTSTITLKWSKVTGADGYRVYQYNAKTKKWVKVKDVTGTSLKINKLTAGTKYKFRVKAYTKDDGTIWGAYSITFETATKCKSPSIIKLTTTKGTASYTWSNVSGESGYQVYYSTKKDSGYKKVASYKANVVKGSKSKLKSGKKYYLKVRAYKKVGSKTVYSSFSSAKSIRIK